MFKSIIDGWKNNEECLSITNNYLHSENKNMYLPYPYVGCLCHPKDKYVSDNYTLKEILVLREDIEKVLGRIEIILCLVFMLCMEEEYQLELSRQVKKSFNCSIIFESSSTR